MELIWDYSGTELLIKNAAERNISSEVLTCTQNIDTSANGSIQIISNPWWSVPEIQDSMRNNLHLKISCMEVASSELIRFFSRNIDHLFTLVFVVWCQMILGVAQRVFTSHKEDEWTYIWTNSPMEEAALYMMTSPNCTSVFVRNPKPRFLFFSLSGQIS